MKRKLTKRDAMGFFKKTIEVGYCQAQDLLSGLTPEWYTCGVYGWNSDIYDMGDRVAVVTGYRPFGNVRPKYDVVREFEDRARAICDKYSFKDYDSMQKELTDLRAEFVRAVTE